MNSEAHSESPFQRTERLKDNIFNLFQQVLAMSLATLVQGGS
jgi:hypothetical protein